MASKRSIRNLPECAHSTSRYNLTRMRTLAVLVVTLCLAAQPSAQNRIPAPESVFGFAPGADYKLATYEQSIEYFKKLASASRYIKLFEAGKTTQGRTMYFALISTPENLARIDRYREIWLRLAHPAGLTGVEGQRPGAAGRETPHT